MSDCRIFSDYCRDMGHPFLPFITVHNRAYCALPLVAPGWMRRAANDEHGASAA